MKSSVIYVKITLAVLASLLFWEASAGTGDKEPKVTLKADNIPLAEVLRKLETQTGVTFSYESSLLWNMPTANVRFLHTPFPACLDRLETLFPIRFKREGRFVIVKRKRRKSGIADILYGDTSRTEKGLPEQFLPEVTVNAPHSDKDRLRSPQIGKAAFSYGEIRRTPVLFGEADIVKTIQTQPGVAPGIAGFADMYVRGGNKDENLYLLEGNPVYQASHAAGLFSAFNVEAVEGMDFYKAGFPARFGGRTSSVTDIRLKDGDLKEYHGSLMLGLTSGNVNLEGPIVKDRTSFSFHLRRTWFDVLTAPALAVWNAVRKEGDGKVVARYAFTDLNFKLTHHIDSRHRLFAGLYWGRDNLKGGSKEEYDQSGEEDISRLRWGNLMAFGGWTYTRGSILTGRTQVAYTRYHSNIRRELESRAGETSGFYRSSSTNGIDDFSFRTDFEYRPAAGHCLRFGGQYIRHMFRPSYEEMRSSVGGDIPVNGQEERLRTHEAGIYAEDEWTVCPWLVVSGGLRLSLYSVDGQTYTNLEPRLNMAFPVTRRFGLKASYSRMSQYVHQLGESYIDLPTDNWISVDRRFKPLRSDQVSAGAYFIPDPACLFAVEGFYKRMDHMLDYKDGYNIYSVTSDWHDQLAMGEGNSYGVEFTARKEAGPVTGSVSYTLSWNNRRFDDINHGMTFPAKFDNRHKLDISANWRVSRKVELNAAWTYMTGNRITVSFDNYQELGKDQYAVYGTGTISPLGPGIEFPGTELMPPYHYTLGGLDRYTGRNNVRLPAYHRLDLGINIHKQLKKGREGVWNVSIYNAYCYMAPVSIQKRMKWDADGHGVNVFQTLRLIPVIPSVSYTFRF